MELFRTADMIPAESRIRIIEPGSFEPHQHWYPKALNAAIHPMVQYFLHLDNALILDRYCHLHPRVKRAALKEILHYEPGHYRWAGADLINVTNAGGKKQMVLIENNSCPSGQKSMPLAVEHAVQGGYRDLMEHSFKPLLRLNRLSAEATLAVLYDKNEMEVEGYASAMADIFHRPVYLVPWHDGGSNPFIRYTSSHLEILTEGGQWKKVTAAFRYVTQKPWNRIPVTTATRIYNPVITCLAGGRNKLMASHAYDLYNRELKKQGLKIRTPETIRNVAKEEVPHLVKKWGGHAVVKVPYSNAGQGVYTITHGAELDDFMNTDFEYSRFIVQSLIGHYRWSSKSSSGKYFHLGTIPNRKGETFVFDIRMMVCATPHGFRPVCVCSRRAEKPLVNTLQAGDASWDMLGTNLSFTSGTGEWATDTKRLSDGPERFQYAWNRTG